MKGKFSRIAESLSLATLTVQSFCASCWAGPPAPPNIQTIPATPVGSVEVSALTVAAVAAYGYWKSRK